MGEGRAREASAPLRVLVVDDAADLRALLRATLELDGGFEVVGEAADGDEAIEVAGRVQPHVVVLDLVMPGADGLPAIPQLRQVAPDARIVVLSGFEAADHDAEARRLGADLYLEKGRAVIELATVLTEVVSGPPIAPG